MERGAFRAAKNLPKPLNSSYQRSGAGGSSVYNPSQSRNPISTQSEAPPRSPSAVGRTWHAAPYNPGMLERSTPNTGATKYHAAGNAHATPSSGFRSRGSEQSTFTRNRLRNNEKVHNKDEYLVGVIFSTAHHVGDENLDRLPFDRTRTESNVGRVLSKYRKFIVVANYFYHCVAIPVYTHEGKGLANKHHKFVDEFISVRDRTPATVASTKADTRHGILWTTNKGQVTGFGAISDLSSAHISRPFCHDYNKPALIHTKLDLNSTERLLQIYVDYVTGGLEEMLKQLSMSDGMPPKSLDPRDEASYMMSGPGDPSTQGSRRRESVPDSWDDA